MIKTKKNSLLKVTSLMMAVMMLMTCVLCGTIAKYVSSGTVSGVTATAGTWNITVGEESTKLENTVTLDSLTWNISNSENGSAEGSYAQGKIVPGTYGYAAIKITTPVKLMLLLKLKQHSPQLNSAILV